MICGRCCGQSSISRVSCTRIYGFGLEGETASGNFGARQPYTADFNAGWDTKTHFDFLNEVLDEFNNAGIRTSVFVSTDAEMIEYAAKAGADRVELYTEPYATAYPKGREAAVAPFVEAAKVARSLGLGLNAGHDLSLVNLNYFYQNIPWLDEVSIGHALISDALYLGLERTVKEYKNCLR